ncbi:MAG TPA: nucleotide sugar dehydrogenase, partial [Myxococcales bacterium]|nr:nucleotide sugar dehydrogenase [Myxococcales bacterium]
YSACAQTDAVVICVPTPFDRMKAPDLSFIEAACRSLAPHVAPGSLVVLQSTTYPGTTEELVCPILETGGRRAGRDFLLAFSPERIDPGNKQFSAHNTPKVVGGIDAASTEAAAALFGLLVPAEQIHRVSNPRVAEMCKLLENIFRSVNIALVNELAMLCNRMGIDVWEVIDAAATKPFGFMPFYPGPGVGGHCIPVDPYYLSWKAREFDFYTKFIELAAEVNSGMPVFTVHRISEALNRRGKPLLDAKVLVLGAAFKRDIDDFRNSPSLALMRILLAHGAEVTYHDPYVPEISLEDEHGGGQAPGPRLRSVPLTEETLRTQDCVCLAVAHSSFDLPQLLTHARLIVDATGATRRVPHRSESVVRL